MRRPFIATAFAVAVVALVVTAPAVAQSELPSAGGVIPLARQPDGRLPLEGTPWRLVGYHDGDREGRPGPEVGAFIAFGAGVFEGSGGCSRVRGQYGVNGAALDLRLRRLPERTCSENVTLVQRAVERGLKQAASYAIEPGDAPMADELVIHSVTGEELLRYGLDDLALLDGVQWRLESYTADGVTVSVSAEMPALLSFQPESAGYYRRRQAGPLSGSSGCNGIVARYFRRSDVLSFSELQVTDAPCPRDLEAQEAAMVAVLEATAVRLDLPYDRLILTSVDSGERLEFMSQVPLEGTTWWLQSTAAGGGLQEQDVTLRLEDGDASGEGPCGPYRADYVTDGVFITFSAARGTRDDGCPELRTERALISGLRRSVTVERTPERLVFRDAQGNRALSFSRPFSP